METQLNEKESLALISKMIEQARGNLQRGSGNSMVFNGCLVAFIAILNVILAFILGNSNQSFWVWTLMIPGGIVNFLINKRVDKTSMVKTHIDRIIATTWNGFGLSIIIFIIVIFGFGFGTKNYQMFTLINPVIMTMVGLAEFVTAKACRFKPYLYGAYMMWLGGICCFLISLITPNIVIFQFLILAICMIIGFVIPGYHLNKLSKEHV